MLKNAVDVGSRPFGKSAWRGKPAAVITHSPGALGGFGANHHLRQSLVCLDVATMPSPEAYLNQSAKLLNDDGVFTAPESRALADSILNGLSNWIDKHTPSQPSA